MGSLRVSTFAVAVVVCLSILLMSPTVDGRRVCDSAAGLCSMLFSCNTQCNSLGRNFTGGECSDARFPGLSVCYCCHNVESSAEMESM
ncbi:low-molecular-weight cysteine-rich 85 [Arabidopsis thaliana]|uniref:Low-molecular-weight cysteine-rich 85 n=1 Tax=Arabidopsis thaliana TaxID=3702 RepID=A0A1P8B6S5_ARATH|nr:low-molecular-weight cysteine-rich 85 [Arabidopsis thaliana]ANM67284.1 low-molecular-weight cysteine-rich 85 [Arabidopsis thaliana]|eukprot:NP_001329122.1 low-molecular-weight cysteine-rich 85 [Arabidopsis thaliana]